MKLHDAARKHFRRDRLTEEGVLRAAAEPVFRSPLDDEDDPRRWLLLDDTGRLLELVLLRFDSGDELVIHAMKARPQYVDLLP
ncbi:toxin [Isoptericola haloaureus]|uniref:Toxin n=1 Tax=Isoptericola haloaureus TaxID=1542902 RepID=A0ABU7Z7Y5_9MICO